VPFIELAPISTVLPPIHSLRTVETTWRKQGALVAINSNQTSLCLFASEDGGNPYSKIKDSCRIGNERVEVAGIILVVKSRGTYEPRKLLTVSKPRIASENSSGSIPKSSSPLDVSDGTLRSGQSSSVRSSQTSTQSPIKQDSSSPLGMNGTTNETTEENIHEMAVSAVLSSLAAFLCSICGYLQLNARTLLAPSNLNLQDSLDDVDMAAKRWTELVSLDISITSCGIVFLRAVPKACAGLLCLSTLDQNAARNFHSSPDPPLWLAPSGCPALFLGLEEIHINDATAETPATILSPRVSVLAGQSWKDRCINWLLRYGVNSRKLETCSWCRVQIQSSSLPVSTSFNTDIQLTEMLWPTFLCFYRPLAGVTTSGRNLPSSINKTKQDPLVFAEQWATGNDGRNSTIMQRQKDREMVESTLKDQVESEARTASSIAFSPVALRRTSIAGVMYPTPPDGIQHNIGATPTFDGVASTPGNPNQYAPAQSQDTANAVKEESELKDPNLWGPNMTRKESAVSATAFQPDANDDFFDDIDGDLFGEHNVTDADFSFFDEPDLGQNDLDNQMDTIMKEELSQQILASEPLNDTKEEQKLSPMVIEEQTPNNVPEAAALETEPVAMSEARPEVLVESSHGNTPDESPVFNDEFVYDRLLRSIEKKPHHSDLTNRHQRASAFEALPFEPGLSAKANKYNEDGPFKTDLAVKQHDRKHLVEIPTTNLLKRPRTDPKSTIAMALRINDEEVKFKTPIDYGRAGSPVNNTLMAGQELASAPALEHFGSMMVSGLKRKRDGNGEEEMTSSLQDLKVAQSPTSNIVVSTTLEDIVMTYLEPDPASWSLADFCDCLQAPKVSPIKLNDKQFMAAAQILSEQAATWTLQQEGRECESFALNRSDPPSDQGIAVRAQKAIGSAAGSLFGNTTQCTLSKLLEVKDLMSLPQASRAQPRAVPRPRATDGNDGSGGTKSNLLISLPAPLLELRRSDTKLNVLPSALSFWENLALSPATENKDVAALCIFPDTENMLDNVLVFLDRLRSSYESCRLGTHEVLDLEGTKKGLLPFEFTRTQPAGNSKSRFSSPLEAKCVGLGKLLAGASVTQKNIVVYFVYANEDPRLPLDICQSFYSLFNSYKQSLNDRKSKISNEIVLQMIPLRFVASLTSIIIPTPTDYTKLALEVYDRCTNLQSMSASSSVLLEQPIPKSLDFKASTSPSVSLMEENSCMHIAYAQSVDERWITAAWTNNIGSRQMTAAYCLGRKNEPLTRSFSEIANEIWETTLAVVSTKKVSWRIMIAKCGVMEPTEVDFWSGLASTESNASVSLVLLTVNTHPSLRLLPPAIALPPTSLSTHPGSLTTPVSTPQTSMLSPDQFGNAVTPARDGLATALTPESATIETDADATLIDITDQTSLAILSHRLNNSNSLVEIHPALISGYLLKRTGSKADDMPVLLEVNIVHVDAKEGRVRGYETLFREVAGYYRGLATLARARGSVDQVKDGRPWHIAAAQKSLSALYMLM
jgi:mediator of RNA polymerase II transcription subunit 13